MTNRIELKYKIRDYGNLDEFVHRSDYLSFGMGSFWTFMGELKFRVNDADFSIEDIAVFQFIINITSALNDLVSETNPTTIPVHYIGTSLVLHLALEDDFVILKSTWGSDLVAETKCSYVKLTQKTNELLYELIQELYSLRPDFEVFKVGGAIQTLLNYHKAKEINSRPIKRNKNGNGTVIIQTGKDLTKKEIEGIIKAVKDGKTIKPTTE